MRWGWRRLADWELGFLMMLWKCTKEVHRLWSGLLTTCCSWARIRHLLSIASLEQNFYWAWEEVGVALGRKVGDQGR